MRRWRVLAITERRDGRGPLDSMRGSQTCRSTQHEPIWSGRETFCGSSFSLSSGSGGCSRNWREIRPPLFWGAECPLFLVWGVKPKLERIRASPSPKDHRHAPKHGQNVTPDLRVSTGFLRGRLRESPSPERKVCPSCTGTNQCLPSRVRSSGRVGSWMRRNVSLFLRRPFSAKQMGVGFKGKPTEPTGNTPFGYFLAHTQ